MRTVLSVVVLASISAPAFSSDCKCARAGEHETTRWGGNEMIVVIEQSPYKHLRGTIEAHDGSPIDGALVEIFTHPEYLLKDRPNGRQNRPEQRRLTACRTKADGKFCFTRLAPGTYELRSSFDAGWDVTHLHVTVDPKNGKTEDLQVKMHLGT